MFFKCSSIFSSSKSFRRRLFLHSLKRRRSFDSIKTFLRLRRPSRNKINLFKSAVIKFGKKMKNKLKLLKWFIELSCNLCKITRLPLLHCDSFSLSRSLVRDAIDQLRYPQFSKTVGNQSRETISIRGNFTSDPGWEEAAETNLAEREKTWRNYSIIIKFTPKGGIFRNPGSSCSRSKTWKTRIVIKLRRFLATKTRGQNSRRCPLNLAPAKIKNYSSEIWK